MRLWDTEYADTRFSIWIRERDPFCFFNCGRKTTDCSHYKNRGNSATRYDPENCDGVCRECHDLYGEEIGGIYEQRKRKQLGEKAYNSLILRANSVMKRDTAVMRCMDLLKNNPHPGKQKALL